MLQESPAVLQQRTDFLAACGRCVPIAVVSSCLSVAIWTEKDRLLDSGPREDEARKARTVLYAARRPSFRRGIAGACEAVNRWSEGGCIEASRSCASCEHRQIVSWFNVVLSWARSPSKRRSLRHRRGFGGVCRLRQMPLVILFHLKSTCSGGALELGLASKGHSPPVVASGNGFLVILGVWSIDNRLLIRLAGRDGSPRGGQGWQRASLAGIGETHPARCHGSHRGASPPYPRSAPE